MTNEADPQPLPVVGAVIVRDGTVLCAQRGAGQLAGRWEFPGGKVEPGEDPRAALRREIEEELRCTIAVGDEVTTTTHGRVTLTTYYCELLAGTPQLIEHTAVCWLGVDELDSLSWAAADLPAVAVVRRALTS